MSFGPNAGIRRNRRPAGEIAVERRLYFSPALNAAIDAARKESGNLSLGLYLELLLQQLETDQGALPVIAPALDGTEVRDKTAA